MWRPSNAACSTARFCATAFRHGRIALPFVAAATSLVGCAGLGQPAKNGPEVSAASESALYLDAVRALIGQGQYYAAIAHIQEDRRTLGDTPELRLLEAEARRNLKQNRTAESLYQSVLRSSATSPLAGKAHHGLGLLYADYDLTASLRELREATRLRPTDAAIRSDTGFALMQARRFGEARTELATASELAPDNIAARNNLLILLFVQGDEAAAARLAAQAQVDSTLLARLKAQAQSFKTVKPPTVRTP